MKRILYKCDLKTDVVITSRSATEGFNKSLDYIPGAKFLGIVANTFGNYDEKQKERTLDLFHNGTVRYGDAHPYIYGERLLKVPYDWYSPKGSGGKKIYLNHKLDQTIKDQLTEQNIKLESVKGKYFSSKNSAMKVVQNFSIKSAYNSEKGRPEDEQMYGYFGLDSGTEWAFWVELDEDKYESIIDEALIGTHRIGRSKSAEYGSITISRINAQTATAPNIKNGINYIYAESNLCFYNDEGHSTLTPDFSGFGGKIDWSQSQVRSRLYQTWNQHRKNRNEDRLIIEKGSVIAVDISSTNIKADFSRGFGSHLNEGFGKVLINPKFLESETEKYEDPISKILQTDIDHQVSTHVMNAGKDDEKVLSYLKLRAESVNATYSISKLVNNFILDHKSRYASISNSQWGQVRKYAKGAGNLESLEKLLFHEKVGFFFQGQTEKDWREKGRRKKLKDYLFDKRDTSLEESSVQEFIIKLSTEMAKSKSKV